MNLGIFEVLAADDSDRRLASRKALVLARTRIDQRLGRFLSAASSPQEFDVRYDLVKDDFEGIVHVACSEVGSEGGKILETLHAHYRHAGKPPWLESDEDEHEPDDENDDESDEVDHKEASVHEARMPKMCPYHHEVVDIALGSGDPQAGYSAMSNHTWGDNHCQGTWEGGKCKFKREMVTQSYWDDRQKNLDEKRDQRAEQGIPEDNIVDFPQDEVTEPVAEDSTAPQAEVIDFPSDTAVDTGESVEPVADAAPLAVAAKTAEMKPSEQTQLTPRQKECEKCHGSGETGNSKDNNVCKSCDGKGYHYSESDFDKSKLAEVVVTPDANNTGLDGPSPKMDKQRWTPKSVPKMDVPSKRHPTRRKDVLNPLPKSNNSEIKEIGEETTEKVDLADTTLDPSGFNKDKNTGTSGPTKTFPKGKHIVNPVT